MKAIVVIDMPENCRLCPFRQSPWSFCLGEYEKEKHCPLKPLPQMKSIELACQKEDEGNDYGAGLIVGWNDCLREITGEAECTTQKKDT